MEFIKLLVEGIYDALEEFFDALTLPSRKFTFNAFCVSCVFLISSVILQLFGIFTFITWDEALTCTILLGIIVLIDSSARNTIKGNISRIKEAASRFTYTGDEESEDEEVSDNEEVLNDESGE